MPVAPRLRQQLFGRLLHTETPQQKRKQPTADNPSGFRDEFVLAQQFDSNEAKVQPTNTHPVND